MARVESSDSSIHDLVDIVKYISKDSERQARLQFRRLIRRCDILEQFPRIGRVVRGLKSRNVRELIEGNYRIIYQIVNEDLIHILSFRHTKRKLKISELRKLIR